MDEKPKSFSKKSRNLPGSFLGWLGLVAGLALSVSLLGAVIVYGVRMKEGLVIIAVITAVAIAGLTIFLFLRWLCCWRNLKRFLFGLACIATLIALFYAEENWRGRHDWEKFKREWEAKGEHFDYASVVPPPVPDDQNFALTPIVASSYEMYFDKNGQDIRPRNTNVVDRLSMITWRDNHWAQMPGSGGWRESKRTDLRAWQDFFRSSPPSGSKETNSFPVTPQPQSPVADVVLALSKYNSAVEEIREASGLPDSRFPLIYTNGDPAAILLPHLAALKSATQTLGLRALAELQAGQNDKALADVKLSLRLADAIRTEPFLISHLVRIAMVNLTLQPVWEGLAEHQWSDAQLVELDQALVKVDFLTDYGVAMRGERACSIGIIDFLQRERSLRAFADLSNMTSGEPGDNQTTLSSIEGILYSFGPSGWLDQNKLRMCRFQTQWNLPLADVENRIVSPKAARLTEAAYGTELGSKRINPYNWCEKMFMPALGGFVKKSAYAQSSVDLARVALALERYRLVHWEFPQSLDALVPRFMGKIPQDIINGQPLKYHRTDYGQFVLYSVGWNETDDSGVVAFNKGKTPSVDIMQGDWVWRYPAK